MDARRSPPVATLSAGRLEVEILDPEHVAAKVRFDRGASVSQVRLDGEAFCGAEDGGTWGVGLCCECNFLGPVGFDQAAPGEWCIKPGVGLLQRPDHEPYGFDRDYDCRPVELRETRLGDDALQVDYAPLQAGSWGLTARRTVRVDPEGLSVELQLHNVGQRPLPVEEYCHNFLSAGPGQHRVELEQPLTQRPSRWLTQAGATLAWDAPAADPLHQVLACAGRGPSWWAWRDPASGRRVRETCSRPWHRFALWTTPQLVCPEAFLAATVAPGDAVGWTRRYTFAI